MRGRFISVEGLDGTGKTTVCAALAARLRASGFQVLGLREPGGTPAGEQKRPAVESPIVPVSRKTTGMLPLWLPAATDETSVTRKASATRKVSTRGTLRRTATRHSATGARRG